MSPTRRRVSSQCDVKTELFAKFTEALDHFIELQRKHLEALKSGESDVWHDDRPIRGANKSRKEARNAYLKHIEDHRCG